MLLLCIAFLFTACNKYETEYEKNYELDDQFISDFMAAKSKVSNKDISPSPQTKSNTLTNVNGSSDVVVLKVELPVDNPQDFDIPELKTASTLSDMEMISEKYAAKFVISDIPTAADKTMSVSESKVREMLKPMIEESKKFLYTKDFTDSEIDEMLAESCVDETALIPLTLIVASCESSDFVAWNSAFSNPFISSAYAVTWGDAGDCALKALGADALFSLGKSSLKTWSKIAIKRAMKSVAKYFTGGVGVLITIGEFTYCMLHKD